VLCPRSGEKSSPPRLPMRPGEISEALHRAIWAQENPRGRSPPPYFIRALAGHRRILREKPVSVQNLPPEKLVPPRHAKMRRGARASCPLPLR